MPQNNIQPPQMQGQPNMSQNMQTPSMGQNQMPPQAQPQGKQEINPEKMLLQFLKDIEQKVEDLSQRVDVLEQQSGGQPLPQ